jgi:hypothetical protein
MTMRRCWPIWAKGHSEGVLRAMDQNKEKADGETEHDPGLSPTLEWISVSPVPDWIVEHNRWIAETIQRVFNLHIMSEDTRKGMTKYRRRNQ